MKRFVQLFVLICASLFFTTALRAEVITKAELAKKYNLAEGKVLYSNACAGCHDTGLLAAPKLHDKNAWQSKMAQGISVLVKHTLEGFNSMPAKGGLKSLTVGQANNVVAYMVEQSLF